MSESRRRVARAVIEEAVNVSDDEIAPPSPDIEAVAHDMLDYMRTQAGAAVILGSLINFRVNEALIGDDANGVSRDRFITTWASIYRSVLHPHAGYRARRMGLLPKPAEHHSVTARLRRHRMSVTDGSSW